MTDPKKLAMSRALGAAFLSHQVEQLQKLSVDPALAADVRRSRVRRISRGGGGGGGQRPQHPHSPANPPNGGESPTKTGWNPDAEHSSEREDNTAMAMHKDASIVVVDASVLVHALGQLKKWCRSNREEIVIVPLEALNTLDLLKKGSSPLAHRARAASRILEQQVGANPRIRVQRDEAYVPWDDIPFSNDDAHTGTGSPDRASGDAVARSSPPTPEWLRRTICCARWELDNYSASPVDSVPRINDASGANSNRDRKDEQSSVPDVVIAVYLEPALVPESATLAAASAASAAAAAAAASSPVPLPMTMPQTSKFEQRCAGTLVVEWARSAGLPVLECKSTAPPSHPPKLHHGGGRGCSPSEEEFRSWPPRHANSNSRASGQKPIGNKFKGPPPYANKKHAVYGPGRDVDTALVERPAATLAMNAKHQQIRVLARGEKLEP